MAEASASARWHGATDVPKKCARGCEPEAARPAAEEPPCEPDRVDDRGCHAPPRQPLDGPVEKAEVEPSVVGDEHRIAGEREEAADGELRARGAAEMLLSDPGQCRDRRRQRDPRVDERLEDRTDLQRLDPLRADLDDPGAGGREPGRLEVEDDERGSLEQRRSRRAGRRARPRRRATRAARRPRSRRRAARGRSPSAPI